MTNPELESRDDSLFADLRLSEVEPFAKGDHRLCYQHPRNARLCVKVNRQGKDLALWKRAPFYKKLRSVKSFNDNWQEYLSFQQPAVVSNTPDIWRHIPRCYGWVATDIGDGLITDFYGRENGEPARTLTDYLATEGADAKLIPAIAEFIACLRKTRLITKNLLPHNILVIEEDDILRLVLIDGFGSLSRLPLYRCRGLAGPYVEKRIKRFFVRISWELSDKSITWEEAQKRNLGDEKDFI